MLTRRLGSTIRILAALGLTLAAAADAGAQERAVPDSSRTATFVGQVVSATTGKPIDGAVVSLRGSGFGAITDTLGRFRIPDAPAGPDTVEVRFIGYEPSDVALELEPARTTHVVLLLSRTVVRVADLRVEIPADRRGKMADFDWRRRAGHGYFISPEEIEKRKPLRLTSDLLRGVPGLHVGRYEHGRQEVLIDRGKLCRPAIYLDGAYMPAFQIDDIAPEELGAIEVYRGPSEIPGEFMRLRGDDCGVIAVWTPEGGVRYKDR